MIIPATRRKQKPKRPKAKWIVLDGEVVERDVTIDGDVAFIHPGRHQTFKGAKRLVRMVERAHVFSSKALAVKSMKPRPVWWLRYGSVCVGKAALERSPQDGGTKFAVYDRKNELQHYHGEIYHSKRSAALALMAERKMKMIAAGRDYAKAIKDYRRAAKLAQTQIRMKGTSR